MDGAPFRGNAHQLGPRVPLKARDTMDDHSQARGLGIPSRIGRLLARASGSCDKSDANLCEKPVSETSMTLPIALGVVIPVVLALGVLIYLHRRNVKRQRQEDMADPHKSLDFGLMVDPAKGKGAKGGKAKRKSPLFGGEKIATTTRHRQLSMDLNLSSPYLLPPGLQSSRESLHSLARSLQQNEDPYRPVAQYAASDVASLHSFHKEYRENSSVHTGSSGRDSGVHARSVASNAALVPPPRQNSLPKTGSPAELPPVQVDPMVFDASMPCPPPPAKEHHVPMAPIIPVIETVAPFEEPRGEALDIPTLNIQEPPPVAHKIPRKAPAPPPPQGSSLLPAALNTPGSRVVDESFAFPEYSRGLSHDRASPAHVVPEPTGLGVMSPQSQQASLHMSPPPANAVPLTQQDAISSASFSSRSVEEPQGYYDNYQNMPEEPRLHDDETRGRAPHRRESSDFRDFAQPGLAVPLYENKRVSVGFRPLPPDEMMDTEDPETRANRIRSFYKEYFDESKPDPAGNQQHQQQQFQQQQFQHQQFQHQQFQHQQFQGGNQYFEDYDQNYMGEAAFFDPESNAFVMPYAQPVARRAMTPPPSGSRFPGPRAPRVFHGSIGGASLPGGRGHLRPGSSASHNWGPRPRSSTSSRFGPRPGSSMSGSYGKPRKPLPPPTALTTLPTPSKLRDDSFALMSAVDFAPPSTFRDQAAGRSQSPLGERRPYQTRVPGSSPLTSSYEEMAAIPSPHLLNKSSAFTGLDFAPPRKFKDSDTMSDAGSIRSNRSGISAVQQQAIRSGAGRISRLPGDTIFTQAATSQKLRPSWNMRD